MNAFPRYLLPTTGTLSATRFSNSSRVTHTIDIRFRFQLGHNQESSSRDVWYRDMEGKDVHLLVSVCGAPSHPLWVVGQRNDSEGGSEESGPEVCSISTVLCLCHICERNNPE